MRDNWIETDRLVGEHAKKAISSLARIPVRELEAAAVALERRGDTGLWHFYRVFDEVAAACRSGRKVCNTEARYRFCRAIERLDERDVERLGGASAPFWRHVREAARTRADS